MESAAGVRSGGRTGLTAVVVAFLFALSTLFAPVLASFPPEATACPLVIVGVFMMAGVRNIDWHNMHEAGPAFITIVMIPFTFNLGNGLIAGLMASVTVSYTPCTYRERCWVSVLATPSKIHPRIRTPRPRRYAYPGVESMGNHSIKKIKKDKPHIDLGVFPPETTL